MATATLSVALSSHGDWKPERSRPDPLEILHASDEHRLPELLPIRYGRMLRSPFTFYRGSAAVMACDLARTPSTGIRVQLCGDAHLGNTRGFATPERNVIFDINDFDETLPGPWEWDVKRLAASFVVAMRANGISDDIASETAVRVGRTYRKAMNRFARIDPLDLWYMRLDAADFYDQIPDPKLRQQVQQRVERIAAKRGSEMIYPKLAQVVHGEITIRDAPPLIYHPELTHSADFHPTIEAVLNGYKESLPDERRILLDRYRVVDAALKVVGVGSVGTRCWIALLMSRTNEHLFLQLKQADASVLERYAGKSVYPHHGQRVVIGTRLMQAASDVFLGWTTAPSGIQFYVRQLRDAKVKPDVESFDATMFWVYAKTCGWNLARAHAKTGDALAIADYLGKGGGFDLAIGLFALAYADQVERDYEALKSAVKAGKIAADTTLSP